MTIIPRRALTGHTSTSVGRKYGNGVPLDVLAEVVAKVSYKSLDLSQLYRATERGRAADPLSAVRNQIVRVPLKP